MSIKVIKVIKVIDSEATCGNIKAILEDRQIKPKEVQRALQLDSVQAAYKWLSPRNKTMPSIDNLVQIANFLGCKIEDVLVMKDVNVDDEVIY